MAQLVRAPPCHGGGRGFKSRLGRCIWDLSSAGRASALQAEGHRFEPYRSHSIQSIGYARVAELADAQDLKSCCGNTVPVRFRSRALNPCKYCICSIYEVFLFRRILLQFLGNSIVRMKHGLHKTSRWILKCE